MKEDIKGDFFRRFKSLKSIAEKDPNIMGHIDEYANGNTSVDECIETIFVNFDLRIDGLKDMLLA